jgi:hypothetical protein
MVTRISDTDAAAIAGAGRETGQISLSQYAMPNTFMPNGGVYVYGNSGGQETKYLIAWRGKWIGFDLTIPGQSQEEIGVYLNAVGEVITESAGNFAGVLTFAALAVAAYWIYKIGWGK